MPYGAYFQVTFRNRMPPGRLIYIDGDRHEAVRPHALPGPESHAQLGPAAMYACLSPNRGSSKIQSSQ